jgi:7-cyano-7-deazaguanine synthase
MGSRGTAFVLLSGGIDSTTCLYIADSEFEYIEALSVDYGQRHKKEIEQAAMICGKLLIPHRVLNLQQIVPRTMLTDPSAAVPEKTYAEIEGVSPTYVPFRNGLMLSALASYVAGERAKLASGVAALEGNVPEWGLYYGAHAEDAQNWAYPDCSPEFNGAMANAIYIGTYHQIRLHTPLQWLTKPEIIRKGADLGVNYEDTWSCYRGEQLHCGVCPTCRARRDGFRLAGIPDPTEYAANP